MICAIYARVSKEKCPACGHLQSDHSGAGDRCAHRACQCARYQGQDPENQLLELRRYAIAQGWEIVEYIDRATAKNSDRQSFQEIFKDASQRKFGVLLVWSLDRLSREGVWETFEHIRKLKQYGVDFESYSEPHFRTTGPAGELMIAIAAWIAKMERIRISERTKAGLARARTKGRVGGRPGKVFDRDRARAMREENPPRSWRAISKELGVAQSSIRDALSGVRETSPRKHQKRVAKQG